MKNNRKTKSWINLMAFILTLGINTLGSIGIINGMNQKAVSDKYHTLITPAPFTFSIWGLIYTLVFISLIAMIIKHKDRGYQRLIDIFTPPFLLSAIFNILWILIFSYEKIGISTIFIFGLLLSLTTLNKKLWENRREIPDQLTAITFGLYAGWLTIATVVNISAFLVSINWNGFGIAPTIWAPLTLAIALIIVLFIAFKLQNVAYTLPVAWAFFGILKESQSSGSTTDYGAFMKPVLIIGMIVLIVAALYQFKKNNFSVLPKE
ncbi:MAG: TspO/MBR family protein [Tissierellia bacterium]|nr:TspO/MBR family protein [Tissierellia bacterium]